SSQIVVHLVHPTLEQRDLELTLERSADGSYRGALPHPTFGRYQLAIEGRTIAAPDADAADWRLGDRIDLVPGAPVTVGRTPEPAEAGDARGDSRSSSRSSSPSDGTTEG
ncbi:MAG: FixH family protein, partial [Actinomycetota bacterium]|nr:FixH family protein [Actinomycetota bacterium]